MNINRHNCEAWFLDYYEGQLSVDQVAELFAFLEEHPDLKEIFESYEGPAFDAAETDLPVFDHKDLLRRRIELPENINEVNYEEFFAAAVDNMLDMLGQARLERFLATHPEKRSELELFRKTILAPDYSEKFDAKDSLKKTFVTAANFDQWAVASLEGTLNDEEKLLFESFLAQHPAYRAELGLFEQTLLRPDMEIVFEHKHSLRREAIEITADNFAEYAVRAMDGELSKAEQTAFEAYMAANAAAASEFELYTQTQLTPETDVVFEAKAGLKKAVVEINTHNFAEFAVAALDHALSSTEQESFNRFVARHPEMAAELEAWKQTLLVPETDVVFEHKAGLYKTAAAITADNFAEYAVAAIDGQLNTTDLTALEAYMAAHPETAAEMQAWKNTVLTADTSVVYTDKAGLKRKTGGALVWFTSNVRYAAAAAVLLFVVTFWWSRSNTGTIEGNMAGNTHKFEPYTRTPGNSITKPENETGVAQQNSGTPSPVNNAETGYQPVQTGNGQKQLAALRPRFAKNIPHNRPQPNINSNIQLLSPEAVAIQPISVDEPGIAYQAPEGGSKTSLSQYVLHSTKHTLDKQPGTPEEYAASGFNASKNAKITGWDVAGSAFNRLTRALGLNMGLNKSRTEGNSLNVGKYNVHLSPGEKENSSSEIE
ncbi:MAG: hypothetical protein MUC87_01250 [Bacteroidia bacterium]|jgi:anti-sigma factor RsiW|nr:hypothetical protein [Bacteroidia bacterium]